MDVPFLGSRDMGWALGLSPGFGWVVPEMEDCGAANDPRQSWTQRAHCMVVTARLCFPDDL